MDHAALMGRHIEIARPGPALIGGHERHMQNPIFDLRKQQLRFADPTRPEAFGSHRRGSPPKTGTTQVSQIPRTVYAMREPSGEKTGLILRRSSWVSWTGSPLGSIFT